MPKTVRLFWSYSTSWAMFRRASWFPGRRLSVESDTSQSDSASPAEQLQAQGGSLDAGRVSGSRSPEGGSMDDDETTTAAAAVGTLTTTTAVAPDGMSATNPPRRASAAKKSVRWFGRRSSQARRSSAEETERQDMDEADDVDRGSITRGHASSRRSSLFGDFFRASVGGVAERMSSRNSRRSRSSAPALSASFADAINHCAQELDVLLAETGLKSEAALALLPVFMRRETTFGMFDKGKAPPKAELAQWRARCEEWMMADCG